MVKNKSCLVLTSVNFIYFYYIGVAAFKMINFCTRFGFSSSLAVSFVLILNIWEKERGRKKDRQKQNPEIEI